ncbi:MAG TPA: endonuclease/exonuclease/phosphatase family protein [Rugosimonospora sp.]|nr:endonuclease/exonuclease/phosphatase family protein [Rugosimonospora sp.]
MTEIHRYSPDVVTVQEVCRNDVYSADGWGPLARAMGDLYGDNHVFADFVPAADRRTNEGLRCVSGQFYGIAVIYHDGAAEVHYGWYHSQDSTPEERAWTCVTAVVGRVTGCTTHLSTDRDVATRQCHELMSILDSSWVLPEVVVAGDFNLTAGPGGPHDVRACVPAGYRRVSDDSLQQVLYTRNVRWVRGGWARMRWTDHPVLYETLRG